MKLHFHPDNIVYIRDDDDVAIYQATLGEFAADYGQPFPALPDGMTELKLSDGAVLLYDRKQNQHDAFHVEPAPYQAVLDTGTQLIAAKAARLAFRAPAPTRPLDQTIPSTSP